VLHILLLEAQAGAYKANLKELLVAHNITQIMLVRLTFQSVAA